MSTTKTESEASAEDVRRRALAVVAAVSLCCLLASAVRKDGVHLPYVWPNVAAAYFISSLPLGMLVAAYLHYRLSRTVALLVGLVGILIGVVVMVGSVPAWQIPGGWVARTTLGVLVATSSLLACRTLLTTADRDQDGVSQRSPLAIALGLALAAVVPSLYLDSRCEYHRQRLGDLVGQYRLGAARELAEKLNAVSPQRVVNGLTVSEVAIDLNAAVAAIESQLAEPLAAPSTRDDRLDRARLLTILGRIEETENLLAPLVRADVRDPRACNLLALAYEGSELWLQSRYWYYESFQTLSQESDQNDQPVHDDLLRAVMGIAYAERKLGHYREAEIAYQRALALDPSAAMNYLMAQFYEDGQQATKAQHHATLAMQMDPARYQALGRDLIDQLETSHFGCMSVFLRRRSTP